MQFKDLEWKDIVSDNVIVSSHCIIIFIPFASLRHKT